MPEVIILLDSSPPPDSTRLQAPSSAQARLSSAAARFSSPTHACCPGRATPSAIPPSSPNFLSDDFNSSLFDFETPGRSAKKRKLAPASEHSLPPAPVRLPTLLTEANPRNDPKLLQRNIIASDCSFLTFSDDADLPKLSQANKADDAAASAIATGDGLAKGTLYAGTSSIKTKTFMWDGQESDPIVFTSSAPECTTTQRKSKPRSRGPFDNSRVMADPAIITIDDDLNETQDWSDPFKSSPDDLLDKILDDSGSLLKPTYSERTAALLASLGTKDDPDVRPRVAPKSKKTSKYLDDAGILDDENSLSDALPRPTEKSKAKKKPNADHEEKAMKAREREAMREQRQREKEAEKERKRLEKEEKAKEKQLAADIAEANKSKTNKKESVPEMIIDMANNLEATSVGNQVVEYMKNLGADHTFFESSIPNIVKWRRKKKSKYNENVGQWEPCQFHIAHENHVLCMLSAHEFVDMVTSEDETRQSLEDHVLNIKAKHKGCKPIYLIEGLVPWMRRNQNSRNRAYQAEVLRQIHEHNDVTEDATAQSIARGRRPKKARKPEDTPLVADDTIEDALLELQVTHDCLIYHTNTASESAEWIKNFSEHISTIPYRHVQMGNYDGAAFCMETGQVRSGEDKVDTFVKMLQEVNRVTAPMAYGIVSMYPSVVDLFQAMKQQGPGLLENVRKSANKNGALTDSRIGPAVSRRLYKVFMGLDESSADI